MCVLPDKPLSEIDLKHAIKLLKIKNFRNVYMRDSLPLTPWLRECGIINLDGSTGPGTHWIVYRKVLNNVYYFDSFGNLLPTVEFLHYMKNCNVFYNRKSYQTYDSIICGHLCLLYLCTNNE